VVFLAAVSFKQTFSSNDQLTDRRRERALAANPASEKSGASKPNRLAAVRCSAWLHGLFMCHSEQTSGAAAEKHAERHGCSPENSRVQGDPPDRIERVDNSIPLHSIPAIWTIKHGNMVPGFHVGWKIHNISTRSSGAREIDLQISVRAVLAAWQLNQLNNAVSSLVADPHRKLGDGEYKTTNAETDESDPKRVMYCWALHAV
jgi:hypothetical protein